MWVAIYCDFMYVFGNDDMENVDWKKGLEIV